MVQSQLTCYSLEEGIVDSWDLQHTKHVCGCLVFRGGNTEVASQSVVERRIENPHTFIDFDYEDSNWTVIN